MGCDIHVFLEKQTNDGWVHIPDLPKEKRKVVDDKGHIIAQWEATTCENRNYMRFVALAGVRGKGPVAKGLPPDISAGVNRSYEIWVPDGHNHTWYPLEEAARIFKDTEYNQLSGTAEMFPAYHYFGVRPEEMLEANYRVILWFDN